MFRERELTIEIIFGYYEILGEAVFTNTKFVWDMFYKVILNKFNNLIKLNLHSQTHLYVSIKLSKSFLSGKSG